MTACPPVSPSRLPRAFQATAWILAAGLAAVGARLIIFKLKTQPLFVDFLAMWTGGRIANQNPARLYDFAAVDRAQAWLLGAAAHDRPFPYPPSALLVFGPLGHLPFWTAAAVWMAVVVTVYGIVAWRLLPRERWLGLALIGLLPGVVWAGLSGQCAFLIGALAISSMRLLDRRPLLAGILLGMAVAFKPTVLLMAPVALLAGGHGRAVAGASLGGVCVIVLSAAIYGLAPWGDWLMVAPAYLAHITHDPRFQSSIVTPVGLALQLGLSGWLLTLWRVVFAALGVALAGLTFRRPAPLATRLTVVFGASLLVSPYAMNYETALLAPGAVLALLTARDNRGRIIALAAYVALAVAGFPGVAGGALLVFLILSLAPALIRPELIRTEPASAFGRPG